MLTSTAGYSTMRPPTLEQVCVSGVREIESWAPLYYAYQSFFIWMILFGLGISSSLSLHKNAIDICGDHH